VVGYRKILVCLALAAGTAAVYWPLHGHGFLNYDDGDYVVENAHVRAGLTLDGLRWALTTGAAGNWHPLTWLSHMADVQLFGINPGAHHVVNLLFHIANSVILFLVFARMTRAVWKSAAVAALFAWHPLHVESVAWIAERKDVLSTFFGLLSLWAYVRYAESNHRRDLLLAFLCFAFGLMAKPMLVTLPFVFLLLDYWPLGRARVEAGNSPPLEEGWPLTDSVSGERPLFMFRAVAVTLRARLRRFGTGLFSYWRSHPSSRGEYARLIVEKLPFFAFTAASSVVTYLVQRNGGAVAALENMPFRYRLVNALLAYAAYLQKTFWPVHLAVIYPIWRVVSFWQIAAALALLVAISLIAFYWARPRPWLLVGWLWFLGMLVPVIGLVQVGSQAMADRYTYLPLVGIFVVLVWGSADAAARSRFASRALPAIGVVLLSTLLLLTRLQAQTWSNSQTLFEHAIAVTKDNYLAHGIVARVFANRGQLDLARSHFEQVLRVVPNEFDAHFGLGVIFTQKGRTDEAIAHYRQALAAKPDADTHYNLGNILMKTGRLDEAIAHFADALRLKPDMAEAQNNWAYALTVQGRLDEAADHYVAALRIKPDLVQARMNLEHIREELGEARTREASPH
jgi:protein O-mannosyl-transferase